MLPQLSPPSVDGRGHRGLPRPGPPLRRLGELVPHLDGWRAPGLHPARGLAPVRARWASCCRSSPRSTAARARHARLPAGGAGRAGQGRGAGQHGGAHDRRPTTSSTTAPRTQKRRWLPGLASGETARRHRPHRAGLRFRPEVAADSAPGARAAEYVIDGAKTFITNGFSANLLVVAVRTGEAGSRGVSLVVDGDREARRAFASAAASRSSASMPPTPPSCFSTMCSVPAKSTARRSGRQGLRPTDESAPIRAAAARACRRLRRSERAVELTVEYTKQRKAFGQTARGFSKYPLQARRVRHDRARGAQLPQ